MTAFIGWFLIGFPPGDTSTLWFLSLGNSRQQPELNIRDEKRAAEILAQDVSDIDGWRLHALGLLVDESATQLARDIAYKDVRQKLFRFLRHSDIPDERRLHVLDAICSGMSDLMNGRASPKRRLH